MGGLVILREGDPWLKDHIHVEDCNCDYSWEGDYWDHTWDPRCRERYEIYMGWKDPKEEVSE